MPGLTIVTVIALAILVSLGTWQYKRLQWKTQLLQEIEAASKAPPFTSLADIQTALEAGDPVDFRRVGSVATPISSQAFLVFTPQDRDVSWRVFRPVRDDGTRVFAALETVPDAMRDALLDAEARLNLVGYVRLARQMRGAAKSSPDSNRWFGFNPMPESHDWGDQVTGGVDVRFYIDHVPGANAADDLPIRQPDIANNHFDYMLTWYGLALVLLVFYVLIHRRAGRLSW